ATFTSERIADPRLNALMRKMVVRENPDFTAAYPEGWPCRIEVVSRSGERKAVDVKFFKGHAMKPLTDAEVESKFRRLTGDYLDPAGSAALLGKLWELDTVADIQTVLELLTVTPSRA